MSTSHYSSLPGHSEHRADEARHPHRVAVIDRFGAIPGLVITVTVSATLLGLHTSHWRGSQSLHDWLAANHTVVTGLVQVFSHILGLIHVQVFCCILRTSSLITVFARPFSLRTAQFVNAASTPRMTWTLPWLLTLSLLTIVLASFGPAILWSIAIAPTVTEKQIAHAMSIPSFETTNLSSLFVGDTSTSASGDAQWLNDKGLFSFDAGAVRNPMLTSASSASLENSDGYPHAKLDSTGYTYTNRSYGAGSSAGILGLGDLNNVNWYRYNETGMIADVSCFRNSTTEMRLISQLSDFALYLTAGKEPDGSVIGGGWMYAGYTAQDILAYSSAYISDIKTIKLQFQTTATNSDEWAFLDFNNTQCNIVFRPQIHTILVNETSKLINVKPLNASADTPPQWTDADDTVANQVFSWLHAYTFGDGCIGGCQIGRSLRLNVDLVQNTTSKSGDDAIMHGTGAFLESLVDNILINFYSTRIAAGSENATIHTMALVSLPSVVFGEYQFIVATLIINITLALLYIMELVRTRAWKDIPDLDFSNVADVTMAALRGGLAIASQDNTKSTDQMTWFRRKLLSPSIDGAPILLRLDATDSLHHPVLLLADSRRQVAIDEDSTRDTDRLEEHGSSVSLVTVRPKSVVHL